MIRKSLFVMLACAVQVAAVRAEVMELHFTPTFFQCLYSAPGKKTCTCYDQRCIKVPCPTSNPPPWKTPPPCPEGLTCAEHPGDYACRMSKDGRHVSGPTPPERIHR